MRWRTTTVQIGKRPGVKAADRCLESALGISAGLCALRASSLELYGNKPVKDPDKSQQTPFEKSGKERFPAVFAETERREGKTTEKWAENRKRSLWKGIGLLITIGKLA